MMKPKASLSLDLDNQWSYMKTHGDTGWEKFPSHFDLVVPSILDILERLNLKITFFIVGQDAALDRNRESLKLITDRGHEVGNHSFHHEPWLHLYTKEQIRKEIIEAEEQILHVTAQKPNGFRGPGFVWSPNLLEVLAENGYMYDATILPSYLSPLARIYYFWKSNLTKEEKEQRKKIFGSIKDAMRPIKPFFWQMNSDMTLLEIPVTTMPIIKAPFHLSYLLYLSRFSISLMFRYLKIALSLCRITHTEPSFLLHPLDFLSRKEVPELAFFPGMQLARTRKIEIFYSVINTLSKDFELVTMSIHAKSIISRINTNSKARYVPFNCM
jgi:hypothetical protein